MFKRTTLVAAIATAALAPSASAASISPSSGSISTPAIDVIRGATVKLGPAGTVRVSGVRQLRVSVAWINATGIARPAIGKRCAIDLGARINANRRTSVRVTYSYIRENLFTRRETRYRFTRQVGAGELNDGSWDFGVCAG